MDHTGTPEIQSKESQILVDSCVIKNVQYAGEVQDVVVDLDITNRTNVLRLIDKGQAENMIPVKPNSDMDAIFSLNIHNIKIIKQKTEELLRRIPIHEIAAVCYIRDHGQHILCVKHGEPDRTCQLAIVYVESQSLAEEICSIISQCFQLVYTEATMQFFDQELQLAANSASAYTPPRTRSGSSTVSKADFLRGISPSFMTRSNPDLHLPSTPITQRFTPRSRRTPSTASELSTPSLELLQEYMQKLRHVLSSDELVHFAKLLRAKRTALPFSDFCDKVLSLFGADRKHLIGGLWPFISEKDYNHFEIFLQKNMIDSIESGLLSASASARSHGRTVSEASGVDSTEALTVGSDRFLMWMDNVLSDTQNNFNNSEPFVT